MSFCACAGHQIVMLQYVMDPQGRASASPARCRCLEFASFLGELPDTLLLRLVVAVRAPPSSSGSHNLCLTGTRLQWLPQRTHGCEGSHCLGSSTADRSHCPSRLRL